MDYSIHDAIEASFNHIVFIIRKDIEKEFKKVIGERIKAICAIYDVTMDLHSRNSARGTYNIVGGGDRSDCAYSKEKLSRLHLMYS